jgi:hypothetical protein
VLHHKYCLALLYILQMYDKSSLCDFNCELFTYFYMYKTCLNYDYAVRYDHDPYLTCGMLMKSHSKYVLGEDSNFPKKCINILKASHSKTWNVYHLQLQSWDSSV